MTRREFLLVSLAAAAVRRQSRSLKNFVWLRPSVTKAAADLQREFTAMRAAGVHGVIAEIYSGSQALFQSKRLAVRAPWLEMAIPIATAAGLEMHAWMWCMPCSIPEILQKHPDWYNVNAKGESAADKPAYVPYYKFLDPARPEVREFVRDTV